jgi:hypothetical protein
MATVVSERRLVRSAQLRVSSAQLLGRSWQDRQVDCVDGALERNSYWRYMVSKIMAA